MRFRLGLLRNRLLVAILIVVAHSANPQFVSATETTPFGSYVWYPGKDGPKSDADCVSLVKKLKPTEQKVQQWYWGRAPNDDFADIPYFLIISADRIETTFSAEGDFDYGDVTFGVTRDGVTNFTLKPDEHPDTEIEGRLTAPSESQIVTVTLFGIPFDSESKDRVSYFCRFQSDGIET